jgi:iron complex transport system ATP-binding protein
MTSAAMGTPLLECREVTFAYGADHVLDRVDLSIPEAAMIGILGPNGSGKSTLIRVLSGVLRPRKGTVLLHGRRLESLSRRRVARDLAVVSQEETPDFGFSVREEVMLGRAPHHGGLHFDNEEDATLVEAAMKKTGVEHLAHRRMEQLSGGERQRVGIARALVQEPKVLLLDEPTNHLDPYSLLSLMEMLREINAEGPAILVVSHDINFLSGTCRQLKILHRGKFRFSGSPEEVITESNLAEAFRVTAAVDKHPVHGFPRITPIERRRGPE